MTTPRLRRPRRLLAITSAGLLAAAGVTAATMGHRTAPIGVARSPQGWLPPAYGDVAPPDDLGVPPGPAPATPPGRPVLAVVTPGGPAVVVPILTYHYIRVDTKPGDALGRQLSVTPSMFADQMRLLHDVGAHTITLGDVLAALTEHRALPPRPVVLTFDDGHNDFATRAVPVLQQYGFVATSFVVPDFLGRATYMTVQQVQQVAAAGMVIGAHTMDHIALTSVPPSVAMSQIDRSRAVLQAMTGQPVADFAYPYGAFDAAVASLVQAAGFRDAVSTIPGYVQPLADRFILHRNEVVGSDTLRDFAIRADVPLPHWAAAGQQPPPIAMAPAAESSPTPRVS